MSMKRIVSALGVETIGVVSVASIMLVVMTDRDWPRQPLDIVPARVDVTFPPKERESLKACLQDLLKDIENGVASGSSASNYADCLAIANKKTEQSFCTTYACYLTPNWEEEGDVAMYVSVDKSNGRIYLCGVMQRD